MLLIMFLFVPWLSPLANASLSNSTQCDISQGPHECRHGHSCPMHRAKESQHHHQEGHGHHSNSDIVCSVSDSPVDVSEKKDSSRRCGTIMKCDNNDGSSGIPAPVKEADFLTSNITFHHAEAFTGLSPQAVQDYQDPPSAQIYKPPAKD